QVEAYRAGAVQSLREELAGISVKVCAVSNSLTVRCEARDRDEAAAERQPCEGRRWRRLLLPDREAREKSDGEGRDREKPARQATAREHRRRHGRAGLRKAGERLEVERDVVGGVEALLGVFLEAVPHDPVEAEWNALIRDRDVGRIFLQDRRHR